MLSAKLSECPPYKSDLLFYMYLPLQYIKGEKPEKKLGEFAHRKRGLI